MASIEEIEEEFRQGLITEKGLRVKKGLLELEIELEEGDITRQGYAKKRQKLMEIAADQCASTSKHSAEHSYKAPPLTVTSKLAKPDTSLVSTLNKLYNKGGKGKSSLTKGASMSAEKKGTPKGKTVTVVCVDSGSMFVPKDKVLLRRRGRMKCVDIYPHDSAEMVEEKVQNLFPGQQVKLLKSTRSGDLFDTPFCDGKSLLEMIGNGSLYITFVSIPSAIVKPQHAVSTPVDPNPGLVNPKMSVKSEKSASVALVKPTSEALTEELFDDSLYRQLQEDSTFHCVTHADKESEGPTPDDCQLGRGEFFLYLNSDVEVWLKFKASQKDILPRRVDNFLVMNDMLMKQFEVFKKSLDHVKEENMTLLPFKHIITYYLKSVSMPILDIDLYGGKFIMFPLNEVDNLCEWILEKRKSGLSIMQ